MSVGVVVGGVVGGAIVTLIMLMLLMRGVGIRLITRHRLVITLVATLIVKTGSRLGSCMGVLILIIDIRRAVSIRANVLFWSIHLLIPVLELYSRHLVFIISVNLMMIF